MICLVPNSLVMSGALRKLAIFCVALSATAVVFWFNVTPQRNNLPTPKGRILPATSAGSTIAWTHAMTTGSPQPEKPGSNKSNFTPIVNNTPTCLVPGLPDLDGYFDHWQKVSSRDHHFVFSAYVDGDMLRIVGLSLRSNNTEGIDCHVWPNVTGQRSRADEQSNTMYRIISPATVELMPEHHDRRYGAAFFKCAVPQHIVPYAVSVVTRCTCQSPHNVIAIAQPPYKRQKVAVCVKALYNNFNDTNQLIEFIELYRILGADRFVIYDYSISSKVQHVLNMYKDQGLVEVESWEIPKVDEIHAHGQLACLNDCLYRKRNQADYIVFVDTDEFIIPRNPKVKTLTGMLAGLPKQGVYIVRNSFFRIDWPDTQVSNYSGYDIVQRFQIKSLLKLNRERKVWPKNVRSKIIVRPLTVDTLGIHFVWRMREPWKSVLVNPNVALLHHYRTWGSNSEKIKDLTMMKFREDLVKTVNETWTRLSKMMPFQKPEL